MTADGPAASTVLAIPLTRAAYAERAGAPVALPPVRIVHLGLGAFHRAHQAWYTHRVDEAGEWGIAAYTGRDPRSAAPLAAQGGLFGLIERGAHLDRVEIVGSIAEAADGARLDRFVPLIAAPSTAIVTLTVTEAGYRVDASGAPELGDPVVAADVERLRRAFRTQDLGIAERASAGKVVSPLARLLLGLEARRLAGVGGLAVVPCDNLPGNGTLVRRALALLAAEVSTPTADWIAREVSFVSTSVDRITPRPTPGDAETVAEATGWIDRASVVTEPFHDWVLAGDFPAGRPAWHLEGARFVDDIEPFERRKLWLLNGAHTVLACAGLGRGYGTVAEAIADPACSELVAALWQEASAQLAAGLDLERYRAELLDRFGNARIAHRLDQIVADSVAKLRVRIAPVALAERAAGRPAAGCARALAAWVSLVLSGRTLPDAESSAVARAASQPGDEAVAALLALIDVRLAGDPVFLATVGAAARSPRP